MAHVLLRELDEVTSDAVADAARTAMQHQPYAIALVQADLDKMVACTERTQMRRRMRVTQDLLMPRDDTLVAVLERSPLCPIPFGHVAPRPDIIAPAAIGPPVRHGRLDRTAQRF